MRLNKKGGRLVGLFTRGYVVFTLVILFIAGLSIWLSQVYMDRLSRLPDIDGLAESEALLAGDYESIPLYRFLNEEDGFAVVDGNGALLFCSSKEIEEALGGGLTIGELECIPSYVEDTYVEMIPFRAEKENPSYILVKHYFGDEESGAETEERTVILDEELNVQAGSLGDNRKKYTPQEIGYLTGTHVIGSDMIKYPLSAVTGEEMEERTLIVLSQSMTMEGYTKLEKKSERMFFLAIPLYLVAVTVLVLWLNRRIKKPLVGLNQAIDSLIEGGDGRMTDLNGPWEIRKIGSDFNRMADMLAESEQQRRQMDVERQRLLADISHDLKTPITVINGYVKALHDGKIPPEKTQSYLELIDRKVQDLTAMVNSFHEFSKVEHPKFSIQAETVEICEWMRGYLANRYDEIEIAGFCLQAMIPEIPLYYCQIDSYQFTRAVDNILYNSIKYNPVGTKLAIGVEFVKYGVGDKPSVRIFLADSGIGIPKDRWENIFEPFVQGDVSRGSGGSGLGLAITRRIVQAHGGSIALVKSRFNGFTTEFEILLPAAEREKQMTDKGNKDG